MIEVEVMVVCNMFMEELLFFKMCKDILNVNFDIVINICVFDILVIFIKVCLLIIVIYVIIK